MTTLHTSPRRFITRAEAARHAGVSIRTIDRWRREGALTTHTARGGRLILIDRSELDAHLRPVPAEPVPLASGA